MASGAETVSLALMVFFGIATAGFLAFMVRDVIVRFAVGPDGQVADGDAVAEAQRLAMLGPAVYLVGFLVVVVGLLAEPDPVAGIEVVTVGLGIIVLAAVPMGAAFYRVWQRSP